MVVFGPLPNISRISDRKLCRTREHRKNRKSIKITELPYEAGFFIN